MPSLPLSLQYSNFPFKPGATATATTTTTTTTPTHITESPHLQTLIQTLNLQPHIEGGYFVETDRNALLIPNPFLTPQEQQRQQQQQQRGAGEQVPPDAGSESWRNASTTIFYLLTPQRPLGRFHRNKARTVHTLHSGRGVYVVLHVNDDVVLQNNDDDEREGGDGGREKVRIESFVVGRDVAKGEKLQWIVEGGKYKASFLLDVGEGGGLGSTDCAECGGLLISETVVPGFDYRDHDFLEMARLEELVSSEEAKELEWLVRKE
ncbi:hypothetical protein FKW77_004313 [Venturia effusa]|uniref:DUF985 domain-containing protein n=1 Tax=Venturia effusa TaxID=50376 RepID=A0A517L937_9PEZI|nr:hypothetical protein FKW77_004313 [Venturia effusa]